MNKDLLKLKCNLCKTRLDNFIKLHRYEKHYICKCDIKDTKIMTSFYDTDNPFFDMYVNLTDKLVITCNYYNIDTFKNYIIIYNQDTISDIYKCKLNEFNFNKLNTFLNLL